MSTPPTSSTLPSPTPQNIAAATTGLQNMLALNDFLHSYGKDQINFAYQAFSAADSTDLGLIFGLNVVEGALWAGGSELGPAGNFAASFFSGLLSSWLGNPPSVLTKAFDTFRDRFEQTCLQVHYTLKGYLSDVATNWNTSFTFNSNTYTIASLADPANAFLNDEGTEKASIYSLKKSVYTYLLKAKYQIYCWSPNDSAPGTDPNQPPIAWMQAQYSKNPAYYYTYQFNPATRCKGASWTMVEYTLGSQPSMYSDCAIPASLAKVFFKDSTPGTTINQDAFYTRQEVFTALGIPVKPWYWQRPIIPTLEAPAAEAPAQSVAYLRAMSEGKTLSQLIEAQGRQPLQDKLVAQAQQDPAFAYNLQRRPFTTIAEFFDVAIDEAAEITVVVESPTTFGIVVPQPK